MSERTTERAVKVELAPTSEQRLALAGRCADARQLWNKTLERREIERQIAQASGEKFKGRRPDEILKEYRDEFYPDFPTALVRPVQQALDRALTGFFKKTGGAPKFKSRVASRWSFSYQIQGNSRVTSRDLPVPKVGRVRFKEDPTPRITGTIVSATISRDVDRWFVSLCMVGAPLPDVGVKPELVVGVDLNTSVVACSDGRRFEIPGRLADLDERIRRAQHDLARYRARRRRAGALRDSARYTAARRALGVLYRKMRNVRANWLHGVTTELARTCTVLVLEDLRVANMTRSAAGTVDAPGANVAAKSGLNRAILNAAFGEFRRQAEYKGKWYGCEVIVVDPAYTSRRCSVCGHVNERPLAVYRVFVCESCGQTRDRDDNAAANIRFRGASPRTTACSGEDVERDQGSPSAGKRQRRSVPRTHEGDARKIEDSPREEGRARIDGERWPGSGGHGPSV